MMDKDTCYVSRGSPSGSTATVLLVTHTHHSICTVCAALYLTVFLIHCCTAPLSASQSELAACDTVRGKGVEERGGKGRGL